MFFYEINEKKIKQNLPFVFSSSSLQKKIFFLKKRSIDYLIYHMSCDILERAMIAQATITQATVSNAHKCI